MLVRDVSETKTIKIQDAEFVLGVIPRRMWRDLSLKLGAVSGLLAKYKDLKPEEISLDKEFQEASKEIQDTYFELARLGVRNHANLKNSEGKEIPYVKDEKGFATEKTIEIYDLNGVLVQIGLEVLTFNQVTEQERKN